MESAIAIAGVAVLPDWTQLPEEILVTLFGELGVPDLIRSGAVCTSWHSAYNAFRDACGPDAAALYCPSTGATFRIPMPEPLPLRSLSPIGSAHGWLVVADEVSNLHLVNPLTGGRVALPPITALHNVAGDASLDEEDGLVYNVYEQPGDASRATPVPVGEARDCMYDRAVLSCAPSAGSACVVLLLHSPLCELSFARPGDERWTWIPPGDGRTGLRRSNFYRAAAYNESDGLFYVVSSDDSIYTLDLKGPSPVARRIMSPLRHGDQPYRYLVHAPWGDLLQAWRFRREHEPFPPVETEEDDGPFADPSVELNTAELYLIPLNSKIP
ncbi:hypothetical protein ACP70R_027172 [Stipagrostis hirtigluma subsp. patula]